MTNQKKDKLFKIAVIFIGILFVVGLFGNIYLLLKKQKSPLPRDSERILPATPTQLAPLPTLAINTTTNKQIYKNNVFTLEIPLDWVAKEPYGEFLDVAGIVTFTPQSEIDIYGEESSATRLTITAETDYFNKSTENTLKKQFDELLKKESSTGQGERLFKIGNLKIDGYNAVKYVDRSLPGDQTDAYYSITTWFRKNDVNYYFTFGPNEKLVAKFTPIYNQILSTFKFLD